MCLETKENSTGIAIHFMSQIFFSNVKEKLNWGIFSADIYVLFTYDVVIILTYADFKGFYMFFF